MFLKEKDFKGVQLRKGNNKMNKKAVKKNVIFWYVCYLSV